jgi:pilus assembly protein Flp/PilA
LIEFFIHLGEEIPHHHRVIFIHPDSLQGCCGTRSKSRRNQHVMRITKMTKLLNVWSRFRDCDKGATLVEYGIALGLAVTLGAGALFTLAGNVGDRMGDASTALQTPAPAPAAP